MLRKTRTVTLHLLIMTTSAWSIGEARADAPQTNGPKPAVNDSTSGVDSADANATIIFKNDFSDESVGDYTDDDFKSDRDWGKVRWANLYDRSKIIDDDGDKKLRMTFPKGKFGHRETGGNAAVSLGTHNEIYQRVTIRFEPGFSFVKTGKIVGVGSNAGWSGGNVPGEGQGYTSRFIWNRNHEAAMYLYHMDQRGKYGDVLNLGFKFETGIDYTLTQHIKVNTGSNKNGILQVWVSQNGGPQRLVVDRNNLRFGTEGRGKTELMFIAPFHGGGDSSFAAQQTSYLTLDDISVSTTKFSDLP